MTSHVETGIAACNPACGCYTDRFPRRAARHRSRLRWRQGRGMSGVCAKCGRVWPCDMAGLFPHRKKRGSSSNAQKEVSAMQNITVGRYDTDHETKGHEWAGWIEPEDRSWIMFVGEDPSNVQVYLDRDPVTGAVL